MSGKIKLYDIQGLDRISFWPLAPGWWILLGLIAATLALVLARALYLRQKHRSWRAQTREYLRKLELELTPENSRSTSNELAHLLRKLAMKRFSRSECAALMGEQWLVWLRKADPGNFNWCEARFLIEAPYCADTRVFALTPIKQALHAAKGWVK